MAVIIKTQEEIEKMKIGGKILAGVLEEVKKASKPTVKTMELDKLAEKLILEAGCQISFRTVKDYQFATCLCINDAVVHGLPGEYQLKDNDLLGIDLGLIYEGLHLDMAETILIKRHSGKAEGRIQNPVRQAQGKPDSGHIRQAPFNFVQGRQCKQARMTEKMLNQVQHDEQEKEKFLEAGKKALEKAIKQAKIGNRIGHISQVIEETIKGAGYAPVESLVGHGVGKTLHEDPHIPGVLKNKIEETQEILSGMTLAIEIIYNFGGSEVAYAGDDAWTISTVDKSLSATFERSIAVLESGPIVLT